MIIKKEQNLSGLDLMMISRSRIPFRTSQLLNRGTKLKSKFKEAKVQSHQNPLNKVLARLLELKGECHFKDKRIDSKINS
jgi:hypothetical protein